MMPISVARVGTSKTINTILRNQIRYLDRAGFNMICVCDDDEWTPAIRALGVAVWPIGMGRRPGPLSVLLWSVRFFRELRRRRPDIVHTHNAFHGIVGRLAARAAGVDVVVQTVHNWWYLEPRSSLRARAYLALERLGARVSDAVLFINQDDLHRAVHDRIVAADRVHYVGNGIDIGSFAARLAMVDRTEARVNLGLRPSDIAIVMVARLEPPKDHATLLVAFAMVADALPDARLVLAGNGLEADDVRRQVAGLRFAHRVNLTGHLTDVAPLVKAADLAVLASHHEGFGRSLVEAMVAGVPVVASNVVGIRDVVRDGETGLLVPPGDASALAAAIVKVAADRKLAERLSKAALERARREFDERRAADAIADVYNSLMDGRASLRG